MTWTDFLNQNASRYLEARQWRDKGWVWGCVVAGWFYGIDLFRVVQTQSKIMWIILVLLMVVMTTWISK